MLFDVGNLVTLGIVILALILFRLLDRGSRSLDKARKYADRIKEDINTFVEEKGEVIRNYGIHLDVEQKSAAELMRRIQALTRDDLAQKVQALAQIDERIQNYDSSLENLIQWTGNVQENLYRIKDESAFVESVGKRIDEVRDKIEQSENDIGSISEKLENIERCFAQENAEALDKAVDAAVSSARSMVSDFEASAQTVERKVEEHREAVDRLEKGREARLLRDEERIEKLLTGAIDRAGSRADKVEESALARLRDQAQERVNLIKANFEEKIKALQDTLKAKHGEIHDQLKNNREEWKAEAAAMNARQKAYDEDWKKDLHELTAFAKNQQEEWNKDISQFTSLARQQAEDLGGAIRKQREDWEAMTQTAGQEIIAATERRLEEYREAQEEQFNQLSGVANDISNLETELRSLMQEATNRVNGDFGRFSEDIRGSWESVSGEFNARLGAIREQLAGVDQELLGIKERSFENVSKKLQGFEDEFLENLSKRSAGIDSQLAAWQEGLDKRLESMAEDAEAKRQGTETRVFEELRKEIAAQSGLIMSDMERLKAEVATFEEGIRGKIREVDESRKQFGEQLKRGMEETKAAAENEISAKIDLYSLSVTDTLRKSQQELETQLRNLSAETKTRIAGLESSSESARKNIEDWQARYDLRVKELDNAIEETRRRSGEFVAENDGQITAARASMEEIRKEIAAQAKLIERTGALKAELDRYVEDMDSNIGRLAQLKNEVSRFENQFTQIKRLEDDVNAKMTRFLSEKHRIEVMENDFNRLLQTSQSVEERLAQVSNSDDILQTMQVQLRRLDDAIKETEEKYQRVERKSKTLQETNDGIDRNFKALQEGETAAKRIEDMVSLLKIDIDSIQSSVQTLSAENEKARDAAEKLSMLDDSVKWLERRIAEMNVARESLARLATELQNLDKDAQTQLKLTRSLLDREEGKTAARAGKPEDRGAPPPRDRENIISLKRQGWKIDEIARTLKISKGEVELILELGPKDT